MKLTGRCFGIVVLGLIACGDPAAEDPCATAEPLSTCMAPTRSPEEYVRWSEGYFDTMDRRVEDAPWPPYSELVARWEWPPWLKLTAYTRVDIEATDTLLKLYPSTVPERDCRAFDVQPFGRCHVVFLYDAHEGRGCPIYEEFTFNDDGEITFIEAWSDLDGLTPTSPDDPWAEGGGVRRLSTRIPGLGAPSGRLELEGAALRSASAVDEDVADFVRRARDWEAAWAVEYEAAGDDLWARGCGW